MIRCAAPVLRKHVRRFSAKSSGQAGDLPTIVRGMLDAQVCALLTFTPSAANVRLPPHHVDLTQLRTTPGQRERMSPSCA